MAASGPGRLLRYLTARRSRPLTVGVLVLACAVLVSVPVSAIASGGHQQARSSARPHRASGAVTATLPAGGILLSVSCLEAPGHPPDDDVARYRETARPAGDPDDRLARRCVTVGDDETGAGPRALAGALRGASWRVTVTLPAKRAAGALLSAVSCPAVSRCMAVGRVFTRSGRSVPLAQAWNGSAWRVLATPFPSAAGGVGSSFSGVSCRSMRDCIAVGDNQTRSGTVTLAELWNGVRWRIQRTPDGPRGVVSMLAGVFCAAPRACMAVGTYRNAAGEGFALAQRWNGALWRVLPAAGVRHASDNVLSAVSCAGARTCIAVGSFASGASGARGILVENWNGVSWRIQPTSILASGAAGAFADVACQSASRCTAVGYRQRGPGSYATLIARWNGSQWRQVPAPGRGTLSELYGVACPAARDCVAVGEFVAASGRRLTLTEVWNGSRWAILGSGQSVSS